MKKLFTVAALSLSLSTSFASDGILSSTGDSWADTVVREAVSSYILPAAESSKLGKAAAVQSLGSFKYDYAKKDCFGFVAFQFGMDARVVANPEIFSKKIPNGILLGTDSPSSSHTFFNTNVTRAQCEQQFTGAVVAAGKSIMNLIKQNFGQ